MQEDHSPESALSEALRPGSWDWNVQDDVLRGDTRLADIFGADPGRLQTGMTLNEILSAVHQEDRAGLLASLARSLDHCVDYEATYRLQINGDIRWVHAVGRCYLSREIKRHVGVALDITGLRTHIDREALRLDRIAQHCLAAYSLAGGTDQFNVREAIGKTLRTIAEELARSTSRK